MNAEELKAIRERAMEATPAPWKHTGTTKRGGFIWGMNGLLTPDGFVVVGWQGFDSADGTKGQKRANSLFIAHARQDIPALLAEVERQTTLAKQLAEALFLLQKDSPTFWQAPFAANLRTALAAYSASQEEAAGAH